MKRLILFEGVYDTLDLMMAHMKAEFERLGYEVFVFSVKTLADSLGKLSKFCQQPVTAVITINNVGYNLDIQEGKNIWDILGIPFIDILVDHPMHYHEALLKMPQVTAVLCIDRNHVAYIKRFYPNIPVVDFLPHGATPAADAPVIPWADRGTDVLYVGALAKDLTFNHLQNIDAYPELNMNALEKDVLAQLLSVPDTTLEAAIEHYLKSHDLSFGDERLRLLIHDCSSIEYRATMFYREKVLQTLIEAGIEVTIYGEGWSQCGFITLPNCHYHPRIPVQEVLLKMYDAKIVLNTMTWFKDGSHERIMNGMCAGAVVVSDASAYLREAFENQKELILYRLEEIHLLPSVIRTLLSHPDQAATIAQAGNLRAVQKEQWSNRADDIHQFLLS